MGNHKELIEKKGIYYHLYTMSYAYNDDKALPTDKTRYYLALNPY